MAKKSSKEYFAGDKVYVEKFECNGVVKIVDNGVYHVEMKDHGTRHFTADELAEADEDLEEKEKEEKEKDEDDEDDDV